LLLQQQGGVRESERALLRLVSWRRRRAISGGKRKSGGHAECRRSRCASGTSPRLSRTSVVRRGRPTHGKTRFP